MTKTSKLIAATIALATIGFSTQASAVSFKVKMACASDYYSYCSQHASGSSGAKRCMRANGSKLSKRCVNALVGAGYVKASYVAKRRASR